jgi:glucoamylase
MKRQMVGATVVIAAFLILATAAGGSGAASTGRAPGGPGVRSNWLNADKDGFGTSAGVRSKLWFTLERGSLTEVDYPRLDVPDLRSLQLIVSDGTTSVGQRSPAVSHHVIQPDARSLVYQQVSTLPGRWQLTETLATDPGSSALLARIQFRSLDGRRYRIFAVADPSLDNSPMGDTGRRMGDALVAHDGPVATALVSSAPFSRTSTGYLGASDGLTDLRDGRMDWTYGSAGPGNIVQTGAVGDRPAAALTFTLVLGFGPSESSALRTARADMARWGDVKLAYAAGWHAFLARLKPPPASASTGLLRREYLTSLMVLAAVEDKTFRGAFVASPTVPWRWESPQLTQTPRGDSAVYHMVWARDAYQIATALLAAGDRGAAMRADRYLFDRQQLPDGHMPQNSWVDGRQFWTAVQMDQASLPTVLAWQLGRSFARSQWPSIRAAADFVAANGPATDSDRWENAAGYSPATMAAEIAGLVCAARIAEWSGAPGLAHRYLATADDWRAHLNAWTYTTTGPLGSGRYYLRIDDNRNPNDGDVIALSDNGGSFDERRIVDASFLELVRLGVVSADDPHVLSTLPVVDSQLRVDAPNGPFWHRYPHDGYGEFPNGDPWFLAGRGRAWPVLTGERGEYELAAGHGAASYLRAIALAGNDGLMLPEQVWDVSGDPTRWGFREGEGTLSATPLAWSHAQFVRLALSIQAGRPVEQPAIVACRYADRCP